MNRRTAASVMAMMAVSGCTLNRSDLRRDNFLSRIGGQGQLIEPKRCALRVAILSRPLRDPAVDAAVWRVADEQALDPEVRQALHANGIQLGMITGELPAEVESLLKAAPPHRVEPMQISLPDGDHTLVSLREATAQVSLLLSRDGQVLGKDYKDVSGWFRVTASYEGKFSVRLRLVPELHHGPIQRGFTALPNSGSLAPQQFMQKDGQKEDTIRELAGTLDVEPNQIVVIGCRADAKGSLGSFLFTQPEANSDRLLQKVVLLWATRSSLGLSESTPTVPSGSVPVEPPPRP